MNLAVQSWQDLQVAMPLDPRSIILNAQLGAVQSTFVRATNLLQSAWVASPLAYTGNNTRLGSLDTTDQTTVQEAAQWSMSHQMVNVGGNIPPTLNKVVFLRAGQY